jgi:hypothetical protein
MQSVSSVCKMSAMLLGIALVLSSASIIPKLAHQILLFVSLPLYILQSDFPRVTSIFSHMFLHSGHVTAHLSKLSNVDLIPDVQHAVALAALLIIIYAVFGKASFGREAAAACLYAALAYFIFTSARAPGDMQSVLKALTTSSLFIFLAVHQFFNAPTAPAAYRNVFLATVYYIAIKFSSTLQLAAK